MRGADHVIVVTPAIRDHVHQHYGVPLDRILLCPNGTYAKDVGAEFGQPLHVVYAGNFAPYENVMTFLKTAALAAGEGTRFVLMGDGAQRNELLDYVGEQGVDIVYLGRKKYDQVFRVLGTMQVGFFGQFGGTAMTGSPIKVLDYASCGLPILAGPGPWAETINRYQCGVIVERASAEHFAKALPSFADRDRWEAMSRNAKKMVQECFLWQRQLLPLKAFYGGVEN